MKNKHSVIVLGMAATCLILGPTRVLSFDLGDAVDLGERVIRETTRPAQRPRDEPRRERSSEEPRAQRQDTRNRPTAEPVRKTAAPTRAQVRATQQQLTRLGYQPGPVDGLMGAKTASAIRQFQLDQGQSVTGQVTAPLLAQLRNASPSHTAVTRPTNPSFDCAKAGSSTEHAICDSAALAERDRRLAQAYARARARSSEPARLQSEQRDWLASRNACGANETCLAQSMDKRLSQLVGTGDATDAMVHFKENVYLIPTPKFSTGRSSYPVAFSCLDRDQAQTLRPAIENAISARPQLMRAELPVSSLSSLLVVYDNQYVMVAGDCLERTMYAVETDHNRSRDEFEVIQIAAAHAAPEVADASASTSVTPAAMRFDKTVEPVTRLYLSRYLAEAAREERIGHLTRYVQILQSRYEFEGNEMFTADEIKNRKPEFLANETIDRWDAAVGSLALDPPVDIRARIELRNYRYDFAAKQIVFPGYHQDGDDDRMLFRQMAGGGIYTDGQFGADAKRGTLLHFLSEEIAPTYPSIHSDRLVEVPKLPMQPATAERMQRDHDVVVAEVAYRITGIGKVDERDVFAMHGRFLGMTVKTNAGATLATIQPEDMPKTAHEPLASPKPATERIHLARPRDILAAAAQAAGTEPQALIRSVYPSSSQSEFARRDEINELADTAQPIDLAGFWMRGYARLAEYDFDTRTFGFDYLVLRYPDELSQNEGGIKRHDVLRLTNAGSSGAPVRFPMAEDEARRLREAFDSDVYFRARLAAEPPDAGALPMRTRVLELVIVPRDSDPAEKVASEIIARIDLSAPEPAAEPQQALDRPGDTGLDMLNLRVGQPLQDAISGLSDDFETEQILFARRTVWQERDESNLKRTAPLAEANVLVGDGGADLLTVFHEPLLDDDPVTGIARTIIFAEGARPSRSAVQGLVTKKYGALKQTGDYAFLGLHEPPIPSQPQPRGELSMGEILERSTREQHAKTASYRCRKVLESGARNLSYEVSHALGRDWPAFPLKLSLVDAAGEMVTAPPIKAANPLWPVTGTLRADETCRADVVLAVVEADGQGKASALRILVSNPSYLAEVETRAKAALARGEGSDTPPTAIPDIDL